MAITAADVKKLRDATGAGMMDAKKALTEAEGDFEKAIEILRVTGAAKAAKRSDRDATNGIVVANGTTMVQVGAETDFVAKNAEFIALAESVVAAVEAAGVDGKEAAAEVDVDGRTVADAIHELAVKIGEKLELTNAAHFDGTVDIYLHRRNPDLPPQVGVMVEYEGDNAEFVHQVALQIASMRPVYVNREDVPADVVATERRIAEETAREEGKPEAALAKIVEGRVGGFFKDVVLVEQPAVFDDKKTVGALAAENGVVIKRFVRFAAGA